jgi:hypothetical protein
MMAQFCLSRCGELAAMQTTMPRRAQRRLCVTSQPPQNSSGIAGSLLIDDSPAVELDYPGVIYLPDGRAPGRYPAASRHGETLCMRGQP